MTIQLGDAEVLLLPGRAAFFVKSSSLVIADLHLGKAATFRARGLPVPEGNTRSDLAKLTKAARDSGAKKIIIAGDLIHSRDGLTSAVLEEFESLHKQLSLPFLVTSGNHDRRAGAALKELPIELVPHLTLEGVYISHDPEDLEPSRPGIAGHLHPGVRIAESRRSSIRTAGFFLKNSEHLILPAFSQFTGIHPMKLNRSDRFFTELGDVVKEVPRELIR